MTGFAAQRTIARQDVYGSIAADESERFAKLVRGNVRKIDPGGNCFIIEDTGKDREIILTHMGEGKCLLLRNSTRATESSSSIEKSHWI